MANNAPKPEENAGSEDNDEWSSDEGSSCKEQLAITHARARDYQRHVER